MPSGFNQLPANWVSVRAHVAWLCRAVSVEVSPRTKAGIIDLSMRAVWTFDRPHARPFKDRTASSMRDVPTAENAASTSGKLFRLVYEHRDLNKNRLRKQASG